jgi:hypothetical protein
MIENKQPAPRPLNGHPASWLIEDDSRIEVVLEQLVRVQGTPYLTPWPSLRYVFLPSKDRAQILFERRKKCLLSKRSTGVLVGTQAFHTLVYGVPGTPGTVLLAHRITAVAGSQ